MFEALRKIQPTREGFLVPGVGERSLAEVRGLYPLVGRAEFAVRKSGKIIELHRDKNTITDFGYWWIMMVNSPVTYADNPGGGTSSFGQFLLSGGYQNKVGFQCGMSALTSLSSSGFVPGLWYYDGFYYYWSVVPFGIVYFSTDNASAIQSQNYLSTGQLIAYAASNGVTAVSTYSGGCQTICSNNNLMQGVFPHAAHNGDGSVLVTASLFPNKSGSTLTIGSYGFTNACLAQTAQKTTSDSFTIGVDAINLDNNYLTGSPLISQTSGLAIASKITPSNLTIPPGAESTINYTITLP